MKKLTIILAALILFSCSTTDYLLEKQQYDEAIAQLVGSLEKRPTDQKKIASLDFALIETTSRDMAAIERLKQSGQPDIWDQVLQLYLQTSRRQQSLNNLQDTTLHLMQFKATDYSPHIKQARTNAASYNYARAQKYLESDQFLKQQQAYRHLSRVEELLPGYRDTKKLLERFGQFEPVYLLYKVRNRFPGYLPYELVQELQYLDLTPLSTYHYRFIERAGPRDEVRFIINIDILDVKISPENTQELHYVETAKVQDGIGYQLDEEGNFIYDDDGKKIEFPMLKTIACYVTETRKDKSMRIEGRVEIADVATNAVIARQYINGETIFSNRSAKFKGDINALSPETFELLGTKDADYPDDLPMILQAGNRFKENAVNFILEEMKVINERLSKNE